MSSIVFLLVWLGGSVMLAMYVRRVAALRKEARENPLPHSLEALHGEITQRRYEVQFQLRRLLNHYPDPLSALVAALHRSERASRNDEGESDVL